MKKGFKSIKTRLMVWSLLAAQLPLVMVCIVIYWQRVDAIKMEAFDKLSVIRDLKVGEINSWLSERTGDAKAFSRIAWRANLEALFGNGSKTAEDAKALSDLSAILERFRESYSDYAEISIVSAQSGIIAVSTDPSQEGKNVRGSNYLTEPLRTGEVYISSIYESRTSKQRTMEFSVPIRHPGNQEGAPGGVLVARIDLEHSIYPLLLNRRGLGDTGETLIVDKDVVALNELRWLTGAPLKLKIDATPALLASQGKSGVVEDLDYRGKKVLAAYTHIPKTGWGFVAKMDLEEIYAPIQELFFSILVLFFVVAAAACLLTLILARRTAQPILAIADVAKRIREGDLSARNSLAANDEIGFLAESFNKAADSVALLVKTEKMNNDLAETLILPKSVKKFADVVLRKFMDMTGSQLGAFYLRRADENRFEPMAAIGVSAELIETFDAAKFEGEFGKSLATGKMTHIDRIPEKTLFTFKTFAGTAIPREMITLPVVIDKEVRAMICLASLGGYTPTALTILSQPAIISLNTALANLLANDETRQIAEALRENNQELQAQQEELESQTEELRKQSEELQSQNVELEQQRIAVEDASRMKSQFLSNMSHELRTPLNSVMALSRVLMMQAKAKLSAEEVNYLEIIERNGKNLLTLINDILDLSKIEAGRMDVSPKPFPLGMTLESIVESISPIADEKQIKIHQGIPTDLPPLESDEIRVSQILQNLIGNAVKFTNAGTVTVSVQRHEEDLSVRVEDTGIGIAESDLPFIFDEFRQVDGSSSRRHEGTGLGLAIARKAARMLGGDITVTSAPGKGSAFTLTLPITWQGMAPVIAPIIGREPPEAKPARKTVLVVDDEPKMAAMIARYLRQEGYDTVTATSGAEAIALAARELPFAVTLDIIMPDIDGWEVLQSLKSDPRTKDIPVIIVSISEDKETGFALGAVGYVSKPLSKKRLAAEIKKIGKPGTRSVMIVDDSEFDRQEISRVVAAEGLAPIMAEDGAACLELLKDQVPDVLVLDLMMPEPDGFAVLEKIRGNPATRDLPVIVVTAKDLTEEDRRKLTGNIFSVLEKSAAASAMLLAEIKRILGGLENHPKHLPGERPAAPRLLIVDDNEVVIIQIKAVLESAGYAADVARGGQEAFDYVSRTLPDGIILDLMMPEIDGFAVLERIRGTRETAKIPVLILTAKDLTPEDFRKLSANNVQQLVQKGDIDRNRLLSKVTSMVEGKMHRTLATCNMGTPVQDANRAVLRPAQGQSRKPNPQIRKPEGTPATILVVEDNPDNMTTFKAVLQNRYRILEATDGEKGLQMAAEERPDLILLDMALPKMDGFTVVQNLKDNRALRHIPVIAMTAQVMKGDREKILEAGCDDYISKPIDPDGFLQKIIGWLRA